MNLPVSFIRLAKTTLVLVYLVIIAGSVVRATGSGMGCPDWPRCFGHWIPPTDVKELPANYRTYFKVQEQAIEPFNAAKTWTEYGNRWVGALLGIFMFIQLVFVFPHRKKQASLFKLSLAGLLLTGAEGVLGAFVVHTNLKTGVITLHMFLSLIILITQSSLLYQTRPAIQKDPTKPFFKNLIILSLVLTTIQMLIGTQVREGVDELLKNFDAGTRWDLLNHIGLRFLIHSVFAWCLAAFNIFLFILIVKNKSFYSLCRPIALSLLCVLILEMTAGAILKLYAIPAWIQPVHLLLATILFGLQWALVLRVRSLKTRQV
ncbi:MAG TPA: COX15/CtaA family protein [Bacteroidia bacterium]|jgi:cytochrome c oxidase assembly protein subunit 15|nr:COX15/CtaA family protein [Bacteroidia bacterium]